ncbi:MAG: cupredoxin domain-containing protein [Patescibacteria group bacterium]
MNNKKLTILIAVLVIILVVILFAFLSNKNWLKPSGVVTQSNTAGESKATTSPVAETKTASLEGVDVSTIVPVIPATLGELPGSADAPQQVVVETSNVPTSAIKLSVSAEGFSPKEFTVSAGQKISLAVSSVDNNTHVFIFPNASLMGLTMMILSGETKLIEFTAPAAGSYSFRDDIPGFRGNTGTMIVK